MKWGGLGSNAGGSVGVGKQGVLNRLEGSFMVDVDAYEDDFGARRHAVGLPKGGRHGLQVEASAGPEGELALLAVSKQMI